MRNSDSAFSKLSSVEGFLNSMYGRIDSVFNPENYYDDKHDVPIINAARKVYLDIFGNDQPLPPYLRYQHEPQEADKVLAAEPLPLKKGERYHPSRVLPKRYEIRAIPVGANAVSESCRTLIIEIHQYLNALNGAVDLWKAKMPSMHYGHHNDATRSIFLMIIHALSDLSAMDLTRSEANIVAEKYIQFLRGLGSDKDIQNALHLSAVTIKRERGLPSTEVAPVQAVGHVIDEFEKIKYRVSYHASRASILEHAKVLKEQLDVEIRHRFAYWVYISSASMVEDFAIAISQRNIPITQEGCSPLTELRMALSHNLSASIDQNQSALDQNQSALELNQPCVVYDSESHGWVSSLQTRYALNGSRGGVYPSLANDAGAMQTWLQYASVLEAMGRLRLGLDRLMELLRVGGDMMAVLHFSQPIQLFLSTINTLLDDLLLCQEKLFDFVSQEQSKIFKKTRKTDSDNNWLKNLGGSQKCIADLKQRIADSRLSLVDCISKIREQITEWEKNPLKKAKDFQENQKDFFIIFENVSALIAPSDEKYAVIARNVRAIVNNSDSLRLLVPSSDFRLSVQPQLVENDESVNSLSQRNESDDDHQINSLEKIEELLVDYSERHGFRFNLPNIKLSLKYEDCTKIVLDMSKYSSKRHQHRATKIYDWFSVILARDKSEKEKLMLLERDILSLRKTPEYQANFKTGKNGLRIDNLIDQIYQWTRIRLDQLKQQESANIPAPHNQSIVRSEEIPMRTESTADTEISIQAKVIFILEKLTKAFQNLKNPRDQSVFIKGWQILCHTQYGFLKRLTGMHATMREYHVKADEWHKLASGSEFFTQLADDTQTQGNKTISDLRLQIRNQLSLSADEVQGEKDTFAKKASQSEKALRDFEKQKWAIVDPKGGCLPWSQAELSELHIFLNAAIGLSDTQEQSEFLRNISLLLLQRQSDIFVAFPDELNKLLETIFFEYQQAPEQSNWKEIVRGLLSLGANPLEWMIKNPVSNPVSNSDTPNKMDFKKNALVYYIVAQQIEFVLSHCQYRAQFLGESVAVLGQKLSNLMRCLQNFGLKLNECVETDNDLSWRVAQKMIPKGDGMRIHRAALFSAVLQFVYLSLNDQLLSKLSPTKEVEIDSLAAVRAEINELQNKYLNALKGKNRVYKRVYNVGYTAWVQLKNALTDVQSELLKLSNVRLVQSKIVTEKKLMEQEGKTRAANLRADASDARAEQERREKEQERREKEQERMEKETLLIQTVTGAIEDSRELEMLNERITSHFSGCRDALSMRNKAISISSLFDREITRAIEKLAQKLCTRSPQLDKNDIEARISLLLKVNNYHKSIAFLLQHGRSEVMREELSASAVPTSAVSSAGLFARSANQVMPSTTLADEVFATSAFLRSE